VQLDPQVLTEPPAIQVFQAIQVLLERLVLKVHLGFKALQALMVFQAILVLQDFLEQPAQQDYLVPLALQATMVFREIPVFPVLLVLQVNKVPMERLVLTALPVALAQRETLELKDFLAYPVP